MRLRIMGLALVLAACGGNTATETTTPASGPELLPQEVQQLTERLRTCQHLSGEFGGDGSERDQEVMASMAQSRCDTVSADVAAMRQKYADHPKVLQSLDEAAREAEAAPEEGADDTAASAPAASGTGSLPIDVIRFMSWWQECMHFGGEFGGDGTERDREVSAKMEQLSCDRADADMAALRRQYRNRADVIKALDEMEKEFF